MVKKSLDEKIAAGVLSDLLSPNQVNELATKLGRKGFETDAKKLLQTPSYLRKSKRTNNRITPYLMVLILESQPGTKKPLWSTCSYLVSAIGHNDTTTFERLADAYLGWVKRADKAHPNRYKKTTPERFALDNIRFACQMSNSSSLYNRYCHNRGYAPLAQQEQPSRK
jgi:hypothetical protein